MPIPIAFSTAALLSWIQLSATPTVLSKLSQPGPNGFSAGSAGFGSSAARSNVIETAQLASAKSKTTNVFLIFSTSSKILSVINSPSLTQKKKSFYSRNSNTIQSLMVLKNYSRATGAAKLTRCSNISHTQE